MERKIGEIFEYNGEWYQCIIGHCNQCSFDEAGTCKFIGNPYCAYRNDKKLACFKKLEKVGEQFLYKGKQIQSYIRATDELICNWNNNLLLLEHGDNDIIDIEIKQTKEDMEENKLNLKPFDIQKAREGKQVCTRDGHKVRILCYDLKGAEYPIVAAIETQDCLAEYILTYDKNGRFYHPNEDNKDLMMLPEKKEGWVNVAKEPLGDDEVVLGYIFNSYEDAVRSGKANERYVATVRIEWEG